MRGSPGRVIGGAVVVVAVIAACGGRGDGPSNVSSSSAVDAGRVEVTSDAAVASYDAGPSLACGVMVDPKPPARASSLRRGSCDFGETLDYTTYDLLCPPGEPCAPPQTGDQLCHRICDDGACAAQEKCQPRTIYVSDTPSHVANLCMCAAGPCVEKAPAPSSAEGGLEAWRAEAPLPSELYYHAAASDDRHLFVAGGLRVKERFPNGSSTSEPTDTIFVADLDSGGVVGRWREAGRLPTKLYRHAIAIVGARLYVVGGWSGAGAATLTNAVFSLPISEDGSVGAPRPETGLPRPRGAHVVVVDPGTGAGARLVVASGTEDERTYDGTKTIAFGAIDAGSAVGSWSTVDAPAALYGDRGAGVAGGKLQGFVSGTYGDTSMRGMYSVRLADVAPGMSPQAFVRTDVWRRDPAALSASEFVRLAGVCDALVFLGPAGSVAMAPIDASGRVGIFRAAARFDAGPSGMPEIASSPSGRIYATGGGSNAAQGAAVWSTRRAAN